MRFEKGKVIASTENLPSRDQLQPSPRGRETSSARDPAGIRGVHPPTERWWESARWSIQAKEVLESFPVASDRDRAKVEGLASARSDAVARAVVEAVAASVGLAVTSGLSGEFLASVVNGARRVGIEVKALQAPYLVVDAPAGGVVILRVHVEVEPLTHSQRSDLAGTSQQRLEQEEKDDEIESSPF